MVVVFQNIVMVDKELGNNGNHSKRVRVIKGEMIVIVNKNNNGRHKEVEC